LVSVGGALESAMHVLALDLSAKAELAEWSAIPPLNCQRRRPGSNSKQLPANQCLNRNPNIDLPANQ
jgi:hypothetical protein